ncbi:hypothetical protein CPLU01_02369 [Colletotrichum plurivorum]|uniref:Uncharacterized protein n=1 Tax=Colletotrichum plurivorum TaxID=2175906 RepID=A0A8H6KWQ3_9PEZI|nr:hypothetical protein CPLU01_02369 [Colletotrichum plurivorum]
MAHRGRRRAATEAEAVRARVTAPRHTSLKRLRSAGEPRARPKAEKGDIGDWPIHTLPVERHHLSYLGKCNHEDVSSSCCFLSVESSQWAGGMPANAMQGDRKRRRDGYLKRESHQPADSATESGKTNADIPKEWGFACRGGVVVDEGPEREVFASWGGREGGCGRVRIWMDGWMMDGRMEVTEVSDPEGERRDSAASISLLGGRRNRERADGRDETWDEEGTVERPS